MFGPQTAEGRRVALGNLKQGAPTHGGWALWRHQQIPVLPWGEDVAGQVESRFAELLSRCGPNPPLDAVTLARQCALAFGFQELVLRWAASRKTINAKTHGRLPRAISADWRTFAALERELLKDLNPHYVENQKTQLPASPREYLEQLAHEGGSA